MSPAAASLSDAPRTSNLHPTRVLALGLAVASLILAGWTVLNAVQMYLADQGLSADMLTATVALEGLEKK